MNYNDIYFVLKNKILKKDSLIFIIINTLSIFSILICISLIFFAFEFRFENYKTLDTRTLIVSKLDDDSLNSLISNIKHVEFVDSNKYSLPAYPKLLDFTVGGLSTELILKPLLIDNIKISNGSNVVNDNDIICPDKFYPYSIFIDDKYDTYKKDIFREYVFEGKTLIGKELNVKNYLDDNSTLKIVGTFKNNSMEELSTCFISKSGFDKYKSDYESCSDDGCSEYNSFMVVVDNYKNMHYVEKELKKLGFGAIRMVSFDDSIFASLTSIPAFIGSVILIISILIIYTYLKKKGISEMRNRSVLLALGYKIKDIKKISFFEVSIIYVISSFISFIIYFFTFIIVHYFYLDEFWYYNYIIPIPYLYFFIFIFLLYLYIIYVNNEFIKSNYNLSIQKLFEE